MKKIYRRKKGFTLAEMVLVLAIVVMLGGIIAGVCASISNSFLSTYNIDDSTDYAMLYAKGFENSFLTNSQMDVEGASGKSLKWTIVNPGGEVGSVPTLTMITLDEDGNDGAGTAVFDPANLYSVSSTQKSKWSISMFYKYDPANCYVDYRIFVKDNLGNSKYVTRYDGGFWIPRLEDCSKYDNVEGLRTVEVVGTSLTKTNLTDPSGKYKFTDEEWALIGDGAMDPDYKDTIVFYYG